MLGLLLSDLNHAVYQRSECLVNQHSVTLAQWMHVLLENVNRFNNKTGI